MNVLDLVERWLRRFVAYPSAAALVAHVLWIVHTHVVDRFENTPRLAFLSPEPGSGKSRALEVTEPLVPRPIVTVNASTAYVFRKIGDPAGLPTLLFDEVDTYFGPRPTPSAEETRGLINSGYRRGAVTGRAVIVGKKVETEELPSFAPVALAGLNQLPDTLMTRSVVIRMQRRRPEQRIEPYRRRVEKEAAAVLCAQLAEWAASVADAIEDYWPDLPDSITDRDADVWEPLLAVADKAGGNWPDRARAAAEELVAQARSRPVTFGIRLLADIRTAFKDDRRLSTIDLLSRLHEMDEAPWNDLHGAPIEARFLAKQLARYDDPSKSDDPDDHGLRPHAIRIAGAVVKGYERKQFLDVWARYCPETGNSGNSGNDRGSAEDEGGTDATAVTGVTDFRGTANAVTGRPDEQLDADFDEDLDDADAWLYGEERTSTTPRGYRP